MGQCHCIARQTTAVELIHDKALTQQGRTTSKHTKSKNSSASDEDQIVKIQSVFRGHRVRKEIDMKKLEQYKTRVIEQLHAFIETCTQNPFVSKLPPFDYEENEIDDHYFANRVFKGLTDIAAGGVYLGEWYIFTL